MTESINGWIAANLVLVPAAIVWLYFWCKGEVNRLDARVNAMIRLLKARGIDLNASADD